MERTLRSLGGLTLVAGLVLCPLAISADTLDQPYLVETTVASAAGTLVMRDVLLVHSENGRDVAAASADDQSLTRAWACYAMVGTMMRSGATRTPYAVGVELAAGRLLPVPVTASVAAPAAGAQLLEATGSATSDVNAGEGSYRVGVRVDAHILAQNGRLEAATYRETTYLADPGQPVGITTCSVQRLAAPTGASAPPDVPVTPT